MVSSGRDFVFGPYTRVRWRFDSCAHHVVVVDRAVVVGHGQATSRLIRSHSIEQGASHRFRARIVREAQAYGMKCAYGCMK